ncbi:cache domain-containing protein [Desulfococcaceae bacterium HSG8]|nr:cache domain-containing protein [Desulfococcaceae bacterium HSG8]
MKNLKLGTQLNISFALVLFVPMIIATVFSIGYYSNKIQLEAVNTINSDLKIADIIYQNSVVEMKNLANAYAQKKTVTVLLSLNLGEKLGNDLAKSAPLDHIDMITVVDTSYKVLVRSHSPKKINAFLAVQHFINNAFSGRSASGTEVVDIDELENEGFSEDRRLFAQTSKMLFLTGVAPVYDRRRENIVGAVIVRRILNNKSGIVEEISKKLKVSTALFEHTDLIVSSAGANENEFTPPSPKLLRNVLESNTPVTIPDISKGGSISKYLPITDFNGKPVGVLMVQRGVEKYLHTRYIAFVTLLSISMTGLVLAFIIKTIIERRIVVRVQRLKNGVEQVGAGDYEHTLKIAYLDEIGELTKAFNNMANDLRQYDSQVKEYNMQLEERVRERTSELQITNEQLINTNSVLEDTLETLNPGVSRLIGNSKQKLGLVYATELVADVCTYTKLNMILGETLMGELMRMFFRESHKLLAQYHGMFDKTVGDQIVAIFGTPKDYSPASPIHPFDAIACAIKLVRVADNINDVMQTAIQDNYSAIVSRHKSLPKEDREGVKIEDLRFRCRIGINTSNPTSDREIDRMRMVMMGAETCVDYTAQGGSVIYAFRLESNGIPGQIHIGENTKHLVEHVYILEEMEPMILKGLGIQSRYRVIGYQSIFDNIYPRTMFYREYCNNIPEYLIHLVNTLKIGKIQIKEIRKINEYLEVDIPYLEHVAGFSNLSIARALLSYSVGESVDMNADQLHSLVFASLWSNAEILRNQVLESLEPFSIHEQTPDTTDPDLVEKIVKDLSETGERSREADIIAMCNQFDDMAFDRLYRKKQTQEITPAKQVISLMKIKAEFDSALIDAIEDLMIAEEAEGTAGAPDLYETVTLPKDPEILAEAIEKNLSAKQRNELMSLLRE